MTAVTYTATRKISSGHTLSSVYSMDISVLREGMVPKIESVRRVVTAIDKKNAEVIRFGNVTTYDISTAPVTGIDLDRLEEFLQSCEDQVFTFDPYGTVAVPGTTFSARLTSDSYTKTRAAARGQGGANDYFRLSFSVSEA